MDYLEIGTLMAAVRTMPPHTTFLRDLLFPFNPATDQFSTRRIILEYMCGANRLAPFVAEHKGSATISRDWYKARELDPAKIAPARTLTTDILHQKQLGEAIGGELTPEERADLLVAGDLAELDKRIATTEEWLAAQCILNNGYNYKAVIDDAGKTINQSIRFYSESTNPAEYHPSVDWSDPDADITADIRAMALLLKKRSLPANLLICGSEVATALINNNKIQRLLDIQRLDIGSVVPAEIGTLASHIATLFIPGAGNITFVSYDGFYDDATGSKPFLPEGSIVVTAPASGRRLHGAVTQIDPESRDWVTIAAPRVGKPEVDVNNDARKLRLVSQVLLAPANESPFISADAFELAG
jgi:hypothetical protein